MPLTVRPVSGDDAESVRKALDSVARERRYILMVEAPPPDDVRRFITESILSDEPYYVAADSKDIVGFCAITRRKEPGFGHVGRLGMGVVASYRGQGLGHRLLKAATDHATRSGIIRIELEVFSSNTPAIRLYESLGFVRECLRRRVRHLDGVWDDMVQMAMVTDEVSVQPRESMNSIIERIERGAHVPNLASLLARMPPTDLQSLLLKVHHLRAARRRPSRLLADHAESRFVRPAKLSVTRLLQWEVLACSRLPAGFEPIELSPVCALGTSSVLANVSQNWAVSTVRNSEVVSDPTNVLALECALRRKRASLSKPAGPHPIHLAARHRVLRPQFFKQPNMATHFSLFALCSGGRVLSRRRFEISALAQHLRFYIHILRSFLGVKVTISVSLTRFLFPHRSEVPRPGPPPANTG